MEIKEADTEDAEKVITSVNSVAGESENITFGPGEFDITVEQEREHFNTVKESWNNVFIFGYIGEELVSISDVHAGKRARVSHSRELGITVRKDHWRMGIGREMMKALIDWSKEAGLRKLNLRVRGDNYGAIKLYEELGFFQQGKLTRKFMIRGEFIDALHMGLELD